MKPDPTTIPLHDIHLPPAVSWWPPAPGWWLLLLLVLIMAGVIVWWRRRKRQRQWRVDALAVLHDIELAYQQHQDAVRVVNELSVWLRRVSVSVYPRQQIAALTGQRWLEALDAVFTNNRTAPPWRFDSHVGRVLIAVPYQQGKADINGSGQTSIDTDPLLQLCKAWLKAIPQASFQNAGRQMYSAAAALAGGGGA